MRQFECGVYTSRQLQPARSTALISGAFGVLCQRCLNSGVVSKQYLMRSLQCTCITDVGCNALYLTCMLF